MRKLPPHPTVDELWSHFETTVPVLLLGQSFSSQVNTLLDGIFKNVQLPKAVSAALQQRAGEYVVDLVAHHLTQGSEMSATFRALFASVLPALPDWRKLFTTPARASAVINCFFISHSCGLSEDECAAWQALLAEWFPQTKDIPITANRSANDLAAKVFDPAWLAIYQPDLEALTWDELDALLATQPPLVNAVYAPPLVEVTLPAGLTAE